MVIFSENDLIFLQKYVKMSYNSQGGTFMSDFIENEEIEDEKTLKKAMEVVQDMMGVINNG